MFLGFTLVSSTLLAMLELRSAEASWRLIISDGWSMEGVLVLGEEADDFAVFHVSTFTLPSTENGSLIIYGELLDILRELWVFSYLSLVASGVCVEDFVGVLGVAALGVVDVLGVVALGVVDVLGVVALGVVDVLGVVALGVVDVLGVVALGVVDVLSVVALGVIGCLGVVALGVVDVLGVVALGVIGCLGVVALGDVDALGVVALGDLDYLGEGDDFSMTGPGSGVVGLDIAFDDRSGVIPTFSFVGVGVRGGVASGLYLFVEKGDPSGDAPGLWRFDDRRLRDRSNVYPRLGLREGEGVEGDLYNSGPAFDPCCFCITSMNSYRSIRPSPSVSA